MIQIKTKTLLGILILLSSRCAVYGEPILDTGEIEGAKYTIVVPKAWNRKLLLIAHGYRKEYFIQIVDANDFKLLKKKVPLYTDLDPREMVYKQILHQGWMLATTSYRRNGYIINDAMLDLDNLLNYIIKIYGKPSRVIMQGFSMGGLIGMCLAEREDKLQFYDGFILIGASLSIPETFPKIVFKPMRPILFLSNQNEIMDPTIYCLQSPKGDFGPALWAVMRSGHCNIFPMEQLDAIYAMDHWLDTGKIDHFRNATGSTMQSVAEFEDGKAYAKIICLRSLYGNLITEFVEDDMKKLGIDFGEHFILEIGNRKLKTLYGTDYTNDSAGKWIAFMEKGNLLIARNLANAAKTMECAPGNMICIYKSK